MQRREQTSLGVVLDSGSGDNWRKSLGAAYDTWKIDFDAHCEATATRNQRRSESRPEDNDEEDLTSFAIAYNAVYHAAKALLNSEYDRKLFSSRFVNLGPCFSILVISISSLRALQRSPPPPCPSKSENPYY